MWNSKKITVELGVFHSKEQADKIVAVLNGKTYYDFHCDYGSYAGNYSVFVSTEYPDAIEDEIKEMIMYVLADSL